MGAKPPMTSESLGVALEYVQQSVDLGDDSTSLTNAFLLRVINVARASVLYAEANPASEIAAQIHAAIAE